jgi:hypothetical protein
MATAESPARAALAPASRAAWIILWIGLVAGTLDIGEDLIFNQFRGITPAMVFRFIASGLLGSKAFRGGGSTVALGVVLHYFIALSWTAVFYAVSRKLAILARRPVVSGFAYGAIVYSFMNFAVLPLSGIPHVTAARTLPSLINGVLAVLFCIGLAISLLMRRYAPPA